MFQLKFIASLVVLMTFFYGWSNATDDDNKKIDCNITRKCSTNEDIVWAVDNEQCYLYRNPCIFATEMCHRREKNKTEMQVVTQEECKKYCKSSCTEEYTPVCGEYDNASKTFSNECDFLRHSCLKNESYIFLHLGECSQAVAE